MMKRMVMSVTALLLSAGAVVAEPVEGLWRTEAGDTGGHLEVSVAPCGTELCGVIRRAIDKDGQEVAGYEHKDRQMIWGMKALGEGKYKGGKIWAPDRDKTYNSKMTLSGNRLKVEGCVLGICRGQTWTRVN